MTARKWTRRVVAIATLAGAAAFGVIEAVPAAAAPSTATCSRIHAIAGSHLGAEVGYVKACVDQVTL